MSKLILTRHGQSVWNEENRFTGWVDVDLSNKGVAEAQKSGQLIKNLNINIDVSYTSYLKRAIKTHTTILKENGLELNFNTSWELNERHYRRSWNTQPPPIEKNDKNLSLFSPLNANIPKDKIPLTESLKDTYDRVVPFYDKEIKKYLIQNKNVLISAHGNSLRALCKFIFSISDKKINEFEIPTGNPLLIDFDKSLKVTKINYLDKAREKNIIINQ